MSTDREREILLRMRADARQLCQSSDELLAPQYRHLLARVDALLEISECSKADVAQSGIEKATTAAAS